MPEEKLYRKILRLLRKVQSGLTVSEIAAAIGASQDSVYKAINRLRAAGKVSVIGEIKHGRGRPEQLFAISPVKIEKKKPVLADEVNRMKSYEEKKEDEEVGGLVLDIVENAVIPNPQLKERISMAAQMLKRKDPRQLLLDMAKWLLKKYRELGQQYKDAYEMGRISAANILKEKMQKIQSFAFRIYNKWLGVPWDMGNRSGRKGPFILHYKFKTREDLSYFDENSLLEFLKLHVQGNTFIEKIKVNSIKNATLAGTDASRQEIYIFRHAAPGFFVMRFPTGITVAVAATLTRGEKTELDARPEPKEWRRYTLEDALEKGLIVPPTVYIDDPRMWVRALEAAMNLRQYVKDFETLFPTPSETGKPIVDMLIRDGRIFPWEHYFSDYSRLTEHGRLVRFCLDEFLTLISRMDQRWRKSLYCGAVKEPRVDIIVPIVLWFLRYGLPEPQQTEFKDIDDDAILSGLGLSDQQLVSLIFEPLRQECEEDERLITFQIIRRFYTLAENRFSRLWVERGGWFEIFQRAIEQEQNEGLPVYDDPRNYAELCESGAVLSFFIDTGISQSFGPRFEVLLPSWALRDSDILSEVAKDVVRRICSLVHSHVMTPYTEVWGGHKDWVEAGFSLLMPEPTALAHDTAADICRDHAMQFEAYLTIRLIKIIDRLTKQMHEKML